MVIRTADDRLKVEAYRALKNITEKLTPELKPNNKLFRNYLNFNKNISVLAYLDKACDKSIIAKLYINRFIKSNKKNNDQTIYGFLIELSRALSMADTLIKYDQDVT